MSSKEMRLKSLKVAENLKKIGIERGDYITFIANNHTDLVPLVIGALAYGAIISPLHVGFTKSTYTWDFFFEKLLINI